MKTALSLDEQEENLEKIKNKTELELFNEFYKIQNNIDLDKNALKIIKEVIKDETDKINHE